MQATPTPTRREATGAALPLKRRSAHDFVSKPRAAAAAVPGVLSKKGHLVPRASPSAYYRRAADPAAQHFHALSDF